MKPKDNLTYQFLGVVGSQFANAPVGRDRGIETKDVLGLYQFARRNKMPLSYLESLRKLDEIDHLHEEYDELMGKYANIERGIHNVSKVFGQAGIDYAFFKSVKPYPEVTVDIDILTFGSQYKEAFQSMQSAGYMILGQGPLSTTFRDIKAGIDFDLYDEVGVSHIVYLDKRAFADFVCERRLLNGTIVQSLLPEADLLAVIAHSVAKEQMYVLSEYLTTLSYLASMNCKAIDSFLSLVDRCHMRTAVGTHLGMTAWLHHKVYGSVPLCLRTLLKTVDNSRLELSRLEKASSRMPHKYHPATVMRVLLEKLGEERARRSFAAQAANMLSLSLASNVIRNVVRHTLRETY